MGFLPSASQLRLRATEVSWMTGIIGAPLATVLALLLLVTLLRRSRATSSKAGSARRPPADFSGEWHNYSIDGDARTFYESIGVASEELQKFAHAGFGVGKITHMIEMSVTQLKTTINYPVPMTTWHELDGLEHQSTTGIGTVGERYTAVWEADGALLVTRTPLIYDWRRSVRGDEMSLEMISAAGPRLVRKFQRRRS